MAFSAVLMGDNIKEAGHDVRGHKLHGEEAGESKGVAGDGREFCGAEANITESQIAF